jgi:hypothetical protein
MAGAVIFEKMWNIAAGVRKTAPAEMFLVKAKPPIAKAKTKSDRLIGFKFGYLVHYDSIYPLSRIYTLLLSCMDVNVA